MERPFRAYEGNAPYVFVCYAHEDGALVYPEMARLRQAGFNIWYDEGVTPSSEWSEELADHIERCAVFLYFVTPNSVVSEHCRREVNFSLEQPCAKLTVHLLETEIPSALRLSLSNRQAILKYNYSQSQYESQLDSALMRIAAGQPMADSVSSAPFLIGEWRVTPMTGELRKHDHRKHLAPMTMALLRYLADRAGEVVSNDDLLEHVWSGRYASEESVYQQILRLRKALGDDPKTPSYVETIPKLGYRMIASISPIHEQGVSGDARETPEPPSSTEVASPSDRRQVVFRTQSNSTDRRDSAHHFSRVTWGLSVVVLLAVGSVASFWFLGRSSEEPSEATNILGYSIAVLPFKDVGGERSLATYGDTLTEELRTVITRYQELRSVSVADSTLPQDVDRASYVLDGSIIQMGERARIRARLMRTIDDQEVWADSFEQPLSTASTDAAELATTIARFVRVQLMVDQRCDTVRRTSRSVEAAAAYCLAFAEFFRLGHSGNIDLELELANAQRALELDPEIADAYRIVARVYQVWGILSIVDWQEAARRAHTALEQGLALVPDDPRLLQQKGHVQLTLELNYPAAEASYEASIDADPLHPSAYQSYQGLGLLAVQRGNLDAGLEYCRRGLRVNDSEGTIYALCTAALLYAGRYNEAARVADAGLAPLSSGFLSRSLLNGKALAYAWGGKLMEASAVIDDAIAAEPEFRHEWAAPLVQVGRVAEARAIVRDLEAMDNPPIRDMVFAYAALNDERAFEWLHKAIDHRNLDIIVGLRANPLYTSLRKDPRWRDLMAYLEAEEAYGSAGRNRQH